MTTRGFSNRVNELLGSRYPIVAGPMRLISLGGMAASVSEAGGFGVIAASGLNAKELEREVSLARSLTDRPFGVNIPLYRENAREVIDAALAMGIGVIYTSAGDPQRMVERIKSRGAKVIHKVSSLNMARKAAGSGVDAVVAMGCEAGGHIGKDLVTMFCLVRSITRTLDIPVIASGGIGDGRGLLAALILGAEGVEIGTRLVATRECPVPAFFKEALCSAECTSTLVLGRETMPIRVLANAMALRAAGMASGSLDVEMAARGDDLYAPRAREKDSAIMPCGQVAGLVDGVLEVREVIDSMVSQARAMARGIGESEGWWLA